LVGKGIKERSPAFRASKAEFAAIAKSQPAAILEDHGPGERAIREHAACAKNGQRGPAQGKSGVRNVEIGRGRIREHVVEIAVLYECIVRRTNINVASRDPAIADEPRGCSAINAHIEKRDCER
jgi:hypothetical protein